jgi:hypothetical protein
MKISIHILIILIFTSCSNQEIEQLKKANSTLKAKNIELQTKIKSFDNAVVIPYDSLGKYLLPVACGPVKVKINESAEITTFLAWSKFPAGFKHDFKITNGIGVLQENDEEALKYVKIKYSESGEQSVGGEYILTFPNGKRKILSWMRYTIVE